MVYTLIRLGIFAVVLAILLITQMTPWIAAAVAAVISLCASYIFLKKPREELANGLYEARHGNGKVAPRAPEKAGSDEDLEDTVVDEAGTGKGTSTATGTAASTGADTAAGTAAATASERQRSSEA
ncbi:hypothetical protein GCM10011399_01240 [Subtercola lobariae]|uniref:DUF4229 domain-containing protein n=1 Tax=Subtercola lobariae TaxID=1588641 RepID=A0A917B0C5_9MICO|nr:hypothetical protein GCM10011399_01240 [Subtercola lobariae]